MTRQERINQVKEFAKPGDTITHTRCGGLVEEHLFLGWCSHRMRGIPTSTTVRLDPEHDRSRVSDIHPANITHINRVPITALRYLVR